jgi:hypothetical protein
MLAKFHGRPRRDQRPGVLLSSTMMTPIGIRAMMGFILLQFVHGAS